MGKWTPAARITRWLESPEGEAWSRDHHRDAHAAGSYPRDHIASVWPAPGDDGKRPPAFPGHARDPRQDPSGRPPLEPRRTRGRSTR